jgi:deoxyhypusine synthase
LRRESKEEKTLPNHLTPEELSKELGIERDEIVRVCYEESIPIYQGKIDKTLFQAHLQAAGAPSAPPAP